ncbi:DNA-(apurinic or apyrimidinic site) endonuclease [Rhopalosiphum padi]|uniref:DNA-(apurinic or apyrimidinic site) endonuclease n=1 Tax=Rhopalosiphum padi TaxID=40932 RepID=UPI00298D702D|nr:DNA-(apurinic or apyrimidinic site) endonuclease [Rhopalosiphum padi]XP_060849932.1 DNA-(apurinic or apyrimidinic site) endonuclease [Rhopalosiphum padi]XP_060849933.1 DNA-(apurinic or apyrimidinic site) endonuclease [Rhopalosiphum padi]XP_060849934.1 DNA-(apurinic or apyrimidinic site) endonuclease [Rhopalosiphum padi]
MSGKTKQKKMADYITTTIDNSKKRARNNDGDDSESKKPKSGQVDLNKINFDCGKKNAKGLTWNLKIISWNVAGLRAWLKKDVVQYLKKENPDIICLQEIKCTEKQMPDEAKLPGYKIYINSGDKAGYSGVALYSKNKPISVRMGKEIKELDDNEGRVIEAEYEQFFLVSTYIPNAGAGLKTLPKRMKWDEEFRKYLKELDTKKPVVLTGDLNVAHEEIDIANPKTNTKNAGFTKEERDNMSLLLEQGFIDTFRTLNPEKTGAYTFWTYFHNSRAKNVGWRLDYFISSKRFMDNVCDSDIRSEVLGSDHCPIVFYINV